MIKLIKKKNKKTDIVILEKEGYLIRKKEGELGKPLSFSSTSNCGTNENATHEINKLINQYKSKGYELYHEKIEILECEIFDKAKWHLDGNFPTHLNHYQTYVHTGFYIGWLVLNNLISDEFRIESKEAIQEFLDKKITCVKLYEEQQDGVFTSDDVNEKGFKFTKDYFDFETGKYLIDYEETLATNLPSLFNVQDTWENFEMICKIIDKRYQVFNINFYGKEK